MIDHPPNRNVKGAKYRRIHRRYLHLKNNSISFIKSYCYCLELGDKYFAKQQLNGFMLLKTLNAKRVKKMLPKFLALIEQLSNSPAKALAASLTSWLEPIVGMWRFSKSIGITEGSHTKMEMISRRAFGFRNFENYRMRLLALCGWNGVINRVG